MKKKCPIQCFYTGIIPLLILAFLNWKIFSSIKKLRSSLRTDSPKSNRLGIWCPKNGVLGLYTRTINFRISSEVQLNPKKQLRTASIRSKRNQRNCKECNFSWVLLSTVILFSVLHIPRFVLNDHLHKYFKLLLTDNIYTILTNF